MSASKKSTTKSSKSPAPATKSAAEKPAATKPAAAKTSARQPSVEAARPAPAAVAPAAPRPTAAPSKPAVKAVAAKPVLTTITARVDVGFGNALYIRGEGAGLSWDRGLAMECVGPELWRVVFEESARGFQFKFLVNDNVWSTGPDFTAAAGSDVTLTPQF